MAMARSCAYRREITDACSWHQDQALNSTIYILYETGPTGFLLKEDGKTKNFKVFLGDKHNCTCPVFKKEKDLCKHICWVLLKKFRIQRHDPLSWQLGLNEREINQMIRGDVTNAEVRSNNNNQKKANIKESSQTNPNEIEQRPITEVDVCPICQDELLAKKLPVTHCRFGCGNNVHIKCMKVWADHQKSNGAVELKCPLCREIFSSFELLDQEFRNNGLFKSEKQDVHHGFMCHLCKSTPIAGKCYKCTSCANFYLCQACFNTDTHKMHSFVFREKINQKFRKAVRDHVGPFPSAVVNSLATRDLRDEDYDLLLRLDAQVVTTAAGQSSSVPAASAAGAAGNFSQIPEKVIKSWPMEKIRENSKLLSPGIQCRVCLRAFQLNQLIRKLPNCKHKFHAECIDNWLLHSHPTCPVDGLVVWDPISAQLEKENGNHYQAALNAAAKPKSSSTQENKSSSSSSSKSHLSMIAATSKALSQMPALDLIINYKRCSIQDKPPAKSVEAAQMMIEKKHLNLLNNKLSKANSSSEKSKTGFLNANDLLGIVVEGRNQTMPSLENALANVKRMSTTTTTTANLNSEKKSRTINLKQDSVSIPSKSRSGTDLLPMIEIKGKHLEKKVILENNRDLSLLQPLSEESDDGYEEEREEQEARMMNQMNMNDLFDLRNLKAKPYQLSRMPPSSLSLPIKAHAQTDFSPPLLSNVVNPAADHYFNSGSITIPTMTTLPMNSIDETFLNNYD